MALGSEIKKTRPALVISPDELNKHLATVIVAPITSTVRKWPFRLACKLKRKASSIALDQIRTVDSVRLSRKITTLDPSPALAILREMFA